MQRPTVSAALAQSGLVPLDARVLMMHVLGVGRAWLVAHDRDVLDAEQARAFFALAKRRRDGEPVAYLVGRREFWKLDLVVSPAVLVPRPETETLVEAALERLPRDTNATVLDLGTGSGAIALAIASERPRCAIVATDVSPEALAVARDNAVRLALRNVTFVASDWYGQVDGSFDLIASNPPYVAPDDPHLAELAFEPRAALTTGSDPLAAIKAIVFGATERLEPGGWLLVEHGHDQAATVRALFESAGFTSVASRRDLAGIDRIVIGRRALA